MEENTMDIYIKAAKKCNIQQRRTIRVKDVAEVVAPPALQNKIEQIKLLEIHDHKKQNYLISMADVVRKISQEFPDISIQSIGEMDSIIEFSPTVQKENKLWTYVKVAFVCITLLAGSATAIMSFHTDAQIPEVLKRYYEIFMGRKIEHPYLIQIPYSIGLAAGIIVFFNHFASKHLTDDPTPIEVEMALYEKDVEDCLIENLSKQRSSQS